MAKSEVNKSQAIRDYYKVNRKAKTQEVIDALAKKSIIVTANLVTTVKSKHNKRQRSVRKVVAKGGVGIPEVKAALAFIKLTGGITAAKKALEVAQEIRAIV
jgi:hypothetical protein